MKIGIDIGGSHIGVGHVDDQGYIKNKEEIFCKIYFFFFMLLLLI